MFGQTARDWPTSQKDCEALKRIVAGLVAMVEFGGVGLVSRACAGAGGMVPRHLHCVVLRLLWPAESAACRLIIALARLIQKELQDPLAERILLGNVLANSTVKITAGSDRLNFRPRPSLAAGDEAEAA